MLEEKDLSSIELLAPPHLKENEKNRGNSFAVSLEVVGLST